MEIGGGTGDGSATAATAEVGDVAEDDAAMVSAVPLGGRAGGLDAGRGGGVGETTRLPREAEETELTDEARLCCDDRSICLNAST